MRSRRELCEGDEDENGDAFDEDDAGDVCDEDGRREDRAPENRRRLAGCEIRRFETAAFGGNPGRRERRDASDVSDVSRGATGGPNDERFREARGEPHPHRRDDPI